MTHLNSPSIIPKIDNIHPMYMGGQSSLTDLRFFSYGVTGGNVDETIRELYFMIHTRNIKFYIEINSNSRDTDTFIRQRKNGADTGDTITIGAGLNGHFEQDLNIDYLVGDKAPAFEVVFNGGIGALNSGGYGHLSKTIGGFP